METTFKRGSRKTDPLEIQIGQRLRERRTSLNISQSDIAAILGITYQQIQKYETGRNSIRATMLYRIARQLGVPISFFFD